MYKIVHVYLENKGKNTNFASEMPKMWQTNQ